MNVTQSETSAGDVSQQRTNDSFDTVQTGPSSERLNFPRQLPVSSRSQRKLINSGLKKKRGDGVFDSDGILDKTSNRSSTVLDRTDRTNDVPINYKDTTANYKWSERLLSSMDHPREKVPPTGVVIIRNRNNISLNVDNIYVMTYKALSNKCSPRNHHASFNRVFAIGK